MFSYSARHVKFGALSANVRRMRDVERYSSVDVWRVSVRHLRLRHTSRSARAASNSCRTLMKRISKRSTTGCGFLRSLKHARMYGGMRRYAQRSNGSCGCAGKRTSSPSGYPSCSNAASCGCVASHCARGSAHEKKHARRSRRNVHPSRIRTSDRKSVV